MCWIGELYWNFADSGTSALNEVIIIKRFNLGEMVDHNFTLLHFNDFCPSVVVNPGRWNVT